MKESTERFMKKLMEDFKRKKYLVFFIDMQVYFIDSVNIVHRIIFYIIYKIIFYVIYRIIYLTIISFFKKFLENCGMSKSIHPKETCKIDFLKEAEFEFLILNSKN